MASKKKNSNGERSDLENQVLECYNELQEKLGRVPNNGELSRALGLSTTVIGYNRKKLIAAGLAAPAPRGKTPGENAGERKPPRQAGRSKRATKSQVAKVVKTRGTRVVGPSVSIPSELFDDVVEESSETATEQHAELQDTVGYLKKQIASVESRRQKLLSALSALVD